MSRFIGYNSIESMASVKAPWLNVGKEVQHGLDPMAMMREAELDWKVEKKQAYIIGEEQKDSKGGTFNPQIEIDSAALVRSTDQKILSVVSKKWHPLQNSDAFEFFLDFVEKGDMQMVAAGSLDEGRLVWGLAEVNDHFVIGKTKDAVGSHFLFVNPHQFGKSIDIRLIPIRFACFNSLSLSLSRKSQFEQQQIAKINHRKAFDSERGKALLQEAHARLATYKEAAEFLASRRYTPELLHEYFSNIFPKKSTKIDDVEPSRNHIQALSVIHSQPGAEIARGSWWQAFNTVTYMTDHLMGRGHDSRLKSAWFGSNRDLKTHALEAAVDLANKSSLLEI